MKRVIVTVFGFCTIVALTLLWGYLIIPGLSRESADEHPGSALPREYPPNPKDVSTLTTPTYVAPDMTFTFSYPPDFTLGSWTDNGGYFVSVKRCLPNPATEAPTDFRDGMEQSPPSLEQACQVALILRVLDSKPLEGILPTRWEAHAPAELSRLLAGAAERVVTERECRNEASFGAFGSDALERGEFSQEIYDGCMRRLTAEQIFDAPSPYPIGDSFGYATVHYDSAHMTNTNAQRFVYLVLPASSTPTLLEALIPLQGETLYTAHPGVGESILSSLRSGR